MIKKSHHFRVLLSFQDITQSLTISNTTVGYQLLVPITLQARSSISHITLTDQPQDPWLINQAKIRTGKAYSNSAATVASNSQFNFKDYLVCPFSPIIRLCQCLIMQFQPRFNEFQQLVPQNPFIFLFISLVPSSNKPGLFPLWTRAYPLWGTIITVVNFV